MGHHRRIKPQEKFIIRNINSHDEISLVNISPKAIDIVIEAPDNYRFIPWSQSQDDATTTPSDGIADGVPTTDPLTDTHPAQRSGHPTIR